MKHLPQPTRFVDDDTEPVSLLFRLRIFPLILGLFLGILLSFSVSQFEEVIKKDVSVAFFLPFIIYLADAVGTQTQNIYSRDLKSGRTTFRNYLLKETSLGFLFGLLFSLLVGLFSFAWLGSWLLTFSVALSTFVALFTAPLIALIVTQALDQQRLDPAAGAGPLATVIQDTVSVLIYGSICSFILL